MNELPRTAAMLTRRPAHRVHAWLALALPAVLIAGACKERPADTEPRARALLDKVAATYQALETYQDTGVVESQMKQAGMNHAFTKTFSTAFKRPGRVRFEWVDTMFGGQKDRHTLVCDGEETHSYWEHLGQYKRDQNLRLGIAAATGVSGGSAHTITSLLLQKDKHFGFNQLSVLSELQVLPDETFEGVPCHVVAGKLRDVAEYTYWIGRDDLLIRKIEQVMTMDLPPVMPPGAVKDADPSGAVAKAMEAMKGARMLNREIRRDIQVNQPIPDASFAFVPPEGSRLVEEFKVGG